MTRTGKAMDRLESIIKHLRSPEGCQWDAAQTPETLVPFLIEETYEVLEAIDSGNPDAIREELGDLLMQIVFHARIFTERNDFDLADVAESISAKLIRRHPHVFEKNRQLDQASLRVQWNHIKKEEKANRNEKNDVFSGIPSGLPALARARKCIERTALKEITDPDRANAWEETSRALSRFKRTQLSGDSTQAEYELGEILFSLVKLSHGSKVDPEEALRKTTNRYIASCLK